MIDEWNDYERFLTDEADSDLRDCCDQVHPCLVAFRGDDPLFVAWVRPFPKGEYEQPLIELFALAAGLHTDRIALSFSGRAWSTEDPIPPVVDGADMRQRTLVIEAAVATGEREPDRSSTLVPFDGVGDELRWGEPVRMGGADGWISVMLAGTVRVCGELEASRDDIREQLERCVLRGHEVVVGDLLAKELGLERSAT